LTITDTAGAEAGAGSHGFPGGGGDGEPACDHGGPDIALQHGSWRGFSCLASRLAGVVGRWPRGAEDFLDSAGFDRGPWLAVGFGAGIAAWFALPSRWEWLALLAACGGVALLAWAWRGEQPYLRRAALMTALAVAAGCGVVWAKAALVGMPPISRFMVGELTGRVLERDDEPARNCIRLRLATREPRSGRAIAVRIALQRGMDRPGLAEGAVVRVRARLMAPRPPQLPGGFDFARAAWFDGLAGTGSALAVPVVIAPADADDWLDRWRHGLAGHVRARVPGSAGGIAAAFASGDRGGIDPEDDTAMRDAGLTHLLSVSGLHVSAVVGIVYGVALRLLALSPWLALRVRLPLLASAAGGVAAVGYTVMTGAEVPTVRSCLGALLVMAAVALGRNPLSMRLLATAAGLVMLVWPEAVVGPSFQMSFGSVMAIIALSEAASARAFLAVRGEAWPLRLARHLFMVLLTGMVIELALMPMAVFHFHRAGVYGSLANVVAIPLTTLVTMPAIGLALVLDMVGWGGPAWWVVERSLLWLLGIAHFTAGQPGAVSLVPVSDGAGYALFVAGMLWLALWRGTVRLWGLAPALAGVIALALARPPDLLVTGDGHNLGIVDRERGRLLILREGRSTFAREMMLGSAGMAGDVVPLEDSAGARCNRDACLFHLARGGRDWRVLVVRRTAWDLGMDLRAACARVDIAIVPQKFADGCRPAMALIDKTLLLRTGGMAIDLERRRVRTVGEGEGEHPWWRFPHRMPREVDDEGEVN
jgi:competence protein ComEC